MKTQEKIAGRVTRGIPFDLDLLDRDLDSHFPDFGKGRPLMWGLAVGALPNSWNDATRIRGIDWQIRFHLPGDLKVPRPKTGQARTKWETIRQHCALLAVGTGETSLNGARDIGRSAVRSLLGLVRREVPVLLPSDILWEGAIAPISSRRFRMSRADLRLEPAKPMDSNRLHRAGLRLAKVSVRAMPRQLRRALEWLSLARSARVRPEKFIHLWLAVLALASYGQPIRDRDMTRIRRYTATMTHGIGGVRSPLWVADLNERLRRAHRLRTALVHRDDASGITSPVLESLEADAFEMIDFELAKIGAAIPDKS